MYDDEVLCIDELMPIESFEYGVFEDKEERRECYHGFKMLSYRRVLDPTNWLLEQPMFEPEVVVSFECFIVLMRNLDYTKEQDDVRLKLLPFRDDILRELSSRSEDFIYLFGDVGVRGSFLKMVTRLLMVEMELLPGVCYVKNYLLKDDEVTCLKSLLERIVNREIPDDDQMMIDCAKDCVVYSESYRQLVAVFPSDAVLVYGNTDKLSMSVVTMSFLVFCFTEADTLSWDDLTVARGVIDLLRSVPRSISQVVSELACLESKYGDSRMVLYFLKPVPGPVISNVTEVIRSESIAQYNVHMRENAVMCMHDVVSSKTLSLIFHCFEALFGDGNRRLFTWDYAGNVCQFQLSDMVTLFMLSYLISSFINYFTRCYHSIFG